MLVENSMILDDRLVFWKNSMKKLSHQHLEFGILPLDLAHVVASYGRGEVGNGSCLELYSWFNIYN